MEQFKEWVVHHKALAAGGGIALGLLLFLWLRSSGAPAPAAGASAGDPLSAYYGAQAAAAGDTAETSQSTNELAASTNQTNAATTVGLAQIAAGAIPYQAQLEALTEQLNLTAYQDYLSEQAGAGPSGSGVTGGQIWRQAVNAIGGNTLYTGGDNGVPLLEVNPATGQTSLNAETPNSWTAIASGAATTNVTWDGIAGHAPVAYTPTPTSTTPPLQFGQFVGIQTPQLTPTTPVAGSA